MLQEVGLSDCTVEGQKEDCEFYEEIILLLALRNYFYKCVYNDMLTVNLNDVPGELFSYNVLVGQRSSYLTTSVIEIRLLQ